MEAGYDLLKNAQRELEFFAGEPIRPKPDFCLLHLARYAFEAAVELPVIPARENQ